ncbi:alpha/beta hydrolase family protein [Acinetobacter venetianus]|uniref:alpha/beta hydrolase family protein n=1 Tax=Acinetobacter venetianus TaxID=52133 RepID=UPI001023E8E6|nr:alpha/beta fold hydrolase [Acinetobacter venetianus]RZG78578.1 alpha/beta fold hydrolase [Acinetobacter venetianus]
MSHNTEAITVNSFTITTSDDFKLAATSYEPPAPIANIIIAGATGVPQDFYRRFSRFAAKNGYRTITFDYRGISKSKTQDLNGFKASFTDWATLDLAAVVDEIVDDKSETFMVAHSFGGHAFGQLPNHQKIAGMYVFATGAGWRGWMPKYESIRVNIMWNAILPTLTFLKGYTPMSMLGMGEDLPFGVYQQWRKWCKYPHYFFDDPKVSTAMKEKFSKVKVPIVAANAVDDSWATPRSRDAFIKGYKNADVTCKDILLSSSLPKVGHMGYFRPESKKLWIDVLEWIAVNKKD